MNQVRIALFAGVALVATIGCAGKVDAPTASVSSRPAVKLPSQLLFAAARPIPDSCQTPGETIAQGPAVLVTDSGGVPVGNVLITFELLSGGGTLEYGSAATDANGLASAGAWTLGAGAGVNFVRAFPANGDSVTKSVYFSVSTASVSKVVAVFQLVTIGGLPLPQTYAGSGTITGGHYFLAANGTFEFGYEFGATAVPATICSSARYVTGSSAIDFYLAPGSYPLSMFYAQGFGLFSSATLHDASLLVKYVDTLDFEDETYTLASGSVPLSAVSR